MQSGEIELLGQFTWGSNSTFLVNVKTDGAQFEAVYKPRRGERPLWDFQAETLAGREVAAYLVSEALGWELVPQTVMRADGPYGPGSVQVRVRHDAGQHYFTFDEATRQRLRPVALFDLLVNNADRKGGHMLLDTDSKIWLIDHGICFHVEPKLRTVVWDFAGEPIPEELLADVERVADQLSQPSELRKVLSPFLSNEELEALLARAKNLLAERRFPNPSENERSIPWPLV